MSPVHRCTGFDPNKIYMLGEKNSGVEARGTLQNYEELKTRHLQEGTLFEDPQFDPNKIKLGDEVNLKEVKWLRPKEIRENPQFIIGGEDRFDVNQGILGDCWFLAALADVTQNPKILEKVVPSGQSFDKGYAGIFHFRFWQYGRWIDIVVDDRLPTREIKENSGRITRELIYVKSKDANEFWTALLEKAYAKLYGSYKSLEGGFASEALGDLTGGLTEIHRASQEHWNDDLYDKILESYQKHSFMGCAIMNSATAKHGLIDSHAYSITEVIEVRSTEGNVIKLLRIRNPWGVKEWTGNWSDGMRLKILFKKWQHISKGSFINEVIAKQLYQIGWDKNIYSWTLYRGSFNGHNSLSEKWDTVSSGVKADLSLRVREDGEFWMEFKDFMKCYDILELCHPNPDFGTKHWNSCMLDGAWSVNKDNPQYLLTLKGEDMTSTHTVKIGLMQKNRRVHQKTELPIGFKLLTVEGNLLLTKPSEDYLQVTGHIKLLNGKYVIVPFVEKLDGKHCEYLLRVYSTVDFDLK